MIIDNVILVGIVLSLILCFGVSYIILEKDDGFNDPLGRLIFSTFFLAFLFWGVGYIIFWILKIIFN